MLRATLETRGYRVTGYESAAESLEAARKMVPDLIISDIGMPEIDGFEMIRELRQFDGYHEIPAIALSGYASQKDVRSAIAAGFNAHVSKPVDPGELLMLIRDLLKKSENNSGAQS
jgi:CheY-like chemotaxis protein